MNKTLSTLLIGIVSFAVTLLVVWILVERPDTKKTTEQEADPIAQETTEPNTQAKDISTAKKENIHLKNDEVIQINGKGYTKKDIDFLRRIQKARVEIELKNTDKNLYGQQMKNQDSENLQLQNRVELDVISDLAKQKGYSVSNELLTKEIKTFQDKYGAAENYKKAKQLLGDETFKKSESQYVKDLALRKRLIEEIRKIVKADNPKLKGQELDYEMRQYFDDLYKSAMAEVQIKTKY